MAQCDVCGNEYDKAFEVVQNGSRHTFDSFECAIELMAPRCDNCGVRIMGHGHESNGSMFCGAACARSKGVDALTDRV